MWGDEKTRKLVEPVVTALGYELLGVENLLIRGKKVLLRIYIDAPSGITLEDCERTSHQVSALLNVEELIASAYILEVSSPGLDRPLFNREHFRRFTGKDVSIVLKTPLNGRCKFKGLLKEIHGDYVVILMENEEIELSLENIKKARLVPEF
ncbi:ribosome maturation protein RimP [Candidatus Nitrosoglobus terrae]|uniref:Ribosome maturation factor RimP n=1 Tax=Candidatus Nitrosoglobus terrae TaxID=1630141 RepID=A0A1Q2SNE1_9GAMM|nr:ribosome maturation factor RimP [Candidatus Nitrosoglobus terrae]BAW80656.1 ribosome maturation protein RimP [Candidatus Nitrosoglobus terrae]